MSASGATVNWQAAYAEAAYGLCERRPCGAKGDGIFANIEFSVGAVVIPGFIVARAVKNDSYAIQAGPHEFVYEGCLKEYVNHSCEPNCGVRVNHQGALDLIARRMIAEGDEITVDYAMHSYVIEYFPRRCLCGSGRCRGEVTGWRDLPEARRAAYIGSVAPFLVRIEREGAHRFANPGVD
jgi:hypothetical protein